MKSSTKDNLSLMLKYLQQNENNKKRKLSENTFSWLQETYTLTTRNIQTLNAYLINREEGSKKYGN